MQVEGSYFRASGFSPASNAASPGTMSIGDWRGPLAMEKLSHHLSGPKKKKNGHEKMVNVSVARWVSLIEYVAHLGENVVLNTRVKISAVHAPSSHPDPRSDPQSGPLHTAISLTVVRCVSPCMRHCYTLIYLEL